MNPTLWSAIFVGTVAALVSSACGGAAAPTATVTQPAPGATAAASPTAAPVASPTPTRANPGQTPGPTPTVSAHGAPKGRYVVAVGGLDNEKPDPHQQLTGTARIWGLAAWEGLTGRSADGKLLPRLAKSWTVAPDGLRYDFVLQEGVKYQNGLGFVAEDVGFSIERALRPDLKMYIAPEIARPYGRTEVVAPNRVAVHMKSTYAPLLDRMSNFLYIVPKSYLEQVGDEGFAKAPVGSGPFKWVGQVRGQSMTFEAYENQWNPDRVPRIKTLEFRIIPDPTTQVAALRVGEVDVITSLLPNQARDLESTPGFKLARVRGGSGNFLFFTITPEQATTPFHDVRVRQAVAHAIDLQQIAERVYFGYASPTPSPFIGQTLGFDPTIPLVKYDPELSKRLLAEAGYASGLELTLSAPVGAKTLMEALEVFLRPVGLRTKLNLYEGASFYGVASAHKLPCCIGQTGFGGSALFEPTALVSWFRTGQTYTHLSYPDMDALWDKTATETDDIKRAEVTRQLTRYFQDKALAVALPAVDILFAFGPRVKEFDPGFGQSPINRLEYLTPAD